MFFKKIFHWFGQIFHINNVYNRIAALEKNNAEMAEQISVLQEQNELKSIQISALLKANEEILNRVAVLEKSEKQNLNNHEKYSEAIKELRKAGAVREKQIAELWKSREASAEQIADLQKIFGLRNEQSENKFAEIVSVSAETERRIKELEKSEQRNLNNHEKYSEAIKELRKAGAVSEKQLTDLQKAGEVRAEKLADLQKAGEVRAEQLADLQKAGEVRAEQLADLQKAGEVRAEKLADLQKAGEVRAEQIADLKKICEQRTGKTERKFEEIAAANAENERRIKELEKSEKKNLINHEKYSEAIKELRRQSNKVMPLVKEISREREYAYNAALLPEQYRQELCDWYQRRTGKTLNLDAPRTLNEKINWMKLYDATEEKQLLADKLKVREWIKEKIGEQYLIPLIGVWEHFDDINFDLLPDKFVLKCNHGSGMNILVDSKSGFDKSMARRKVMDWLSYNYAFTEGLELHYKDIKPVVMAEKYMEEEGGLKDYKFLCFHGKVHYIWVDSDRYTNHTRDIFDREWNLQPFIFGYKNSGKACAKPHNLTDMINMAEKLSAGFSFVRVDLYDVDNRIYFGEMTFTSANGVGKFEPEEYDRILGELI